MAPRTTAGTTARPGRGSPGTPPDVDPALREKALLVHARLCAAYGCPIPFFHTLDPLSELVSSLLSHRTKNRDSGRAFRQLRAALPTWTAVRDAPTAEVEAAIAPATWPEQKAPRIQAVLATIGERVGRLDEGALDFLADLPVPEARAWLEAIPGVGPKTSAAVLLFSRLRRPALPVDSHHHRVAVRLGLIPASVDVGPAHARLAAQLPADWDAQTVYDNHEALMLHGQRCCFHHAPDCPRCPVLDLCPTGQARLGAPSAAEAPERPLPGRAARPGRSTACTAAPPTARRGRSSVPPRPEPQEQLTMSVHPQRDSRDPSSGPDAADHVPQDGRQAEGAGARSADERDRLRSLHADPDQRNAEARQQAARREGGEDSVNDPEHYRLSQGDRAHGTHGKGFTDESRRADEQAVDTGDDPQLRTAGGGGDRAPDPRKFVENSEGRMGGPGWGNEQAGGSSVDRRPRDGSA